MLADSPRVYAGVAALVNRLRGHAALGVVTTTWRANVTTVLEALGLMSAFPLIVAKEDCPLLKPSPAPYLLAVERLGILPSEALAFEDSAGGVASSNDAGIRTIAVGHRHHEGPWVGQATYVRDLRDTEAIMALSGYSG